MNTENEVIGILSNINFNYPHCVEQLKRFFDIFLTSWEKINIEAIISNVNVDTIEGTSVFFNELFSSIYRLSLISEISLKADNAKNAINVLDTILPEILISRSNNSKVVLKEYNSVRENAFRKCFELVKLALQEYIGKSSNVQKLSELKNTLLVLTRLAEMRYFHSYVFCFADFLWNMLLTCSFSNEIRSILLFSLSNISEQLVKLLLWKTEDENNASYRDMAINIFHASKENLINGLFSTEEIPYVLNILDKHDRFIGQYFDAVPENELTNGYIICSLQTMALDVDAYEAFEEFSLTTE